MVKVNQKQIENYFRKHPYPTYGKISKAFNVSESLIRKKFGKTILSSLNNKCNFIIYLPHHKFDSNGFKKIRGCLFSKHGSIKETLLSIIKLNDSISSKKLYSMFGFNIRPQVSRLIKEKKIFIKKEGIHSVYSLTPLREEVIMEKEFDITSLKQDDKILRNLQILKEIKETKKTEVARKYNITVDTIRNIERRLNRGGVKGLIHTRNSKTINISSTKEAAIVTELATTPKKTAKEIRKSLNELKSIPLKAINETIKKVKPLIEPSKKTLLEIQ